MTRVNMRLLLLTVCLLAAACARPASSQELTRHVLAEIGTGTWCQWCPYADYTIDSLRDRLGEQLVVLFWHGPATYSDPFWTEQEDSLAAAIGASSYPWLIAGREQLADAKASPIGYPNAWDSIIRLTGAREAAASINFYDVHFYPAKSVVACDLGISVLDPSRLPGADTSVYKIVLVLTEDSLIAQQERGASPGFTKTSIPDFVHNDVVRAVAGSVLGDPLSVRDHLQQGDSVLVHYRLAVNSDWQARHSRLKAILFATSTGSGARTFIDASQSSFLSQFSPPGGPITVLAPGEGDTLFIGRTVPVTFSVQGNVTASRSLQYTTDNGNEWKVFGSVNNATSYQWTVPNTPTTQARVRVVDDSGVTGVGGVFSIVPSGSVTTLTITGAPKVPINTVETISWKIDGLVGSQADLDVSYDSKQTWYPIITGLDVTGTSSYSWKTPSFTTQGAVIRASFASGATGYTSPFDLVQQGSVGQRSEQPFSVRPNPANHLLTLAGISPQDADAVDVYDGLGRQIRLPSAIAGGFLQIDVSQLPAGSYLVRYGARSAHFIVSH